MKQKLLMIRLKQIKLNTDEIKIADDKIKANQAQYSSKVDSWLG